MCEETGPEISSFYTETQQDSAPGDFYSPPQLWALLSFPSPEAPVLPLSNGSAPRR